MWVGTDYCSKQLYSIDIDVFISNTRVTCKRMHHATKPLYELQQRYESPPPDVLLPFLKVALSTGYQQQQTNC
jgi:hypothetical protein